MGGYSSAEQRQHGFQSVVLGVEPPIETLTRHRLPYDPRHISIRWLAAVVLTGVAGSGLIGVTIHAALNGRSSLAQTPEFATKSRRDAGGGERPTRGDRLVRSADVVAEKQSFRAPTTVKVGDKQIVKMRGFTHVATTLALTPISAASRHSRVQPAETVGRQRQSA